MPDHHNIIELRMQCLQLAASAWRPEMNCSLAQLAGEFLFFAEHGRSDPTPSHPPKWAHDIANALVELAQKVREMSAATDRLTASVSANTTATDAAVAAFEAGSTSPALEATINAQSDIVDANTAKLTAATPPPPVV